MIGNTSTKSRNYPASVQPKAVMTGAVGEVDPGGRGGQPVVVFTTGGFRCALAARDIERVVGATEIAPLPPAPAFVLGVINHHGSPIAVVDLARRLGGTGESLRPEHRFLIVTTPRRRLALFAATVEGIRVPAPSAVRPVIGLAPEAAGVAAIGAEADGLLYIHDLETLLSPAEDRAVGEALGTAA